MLKTLLCIVVLGIMELVLLPFQVLAYKEVASTFWHDWMEAWREAFTGWKNKDKGGHEMITVSYMLERVENGLLDEVRWVEAHGFKRSPEASEQGVRWDSGDVRLVLEPDLQWTVFTSFGLMDGNTPQEALARCREWLDGKLKTRSTMQELKESVDRMLDEPQQPAASGILRCFRGRAIPLECCRKMDELERDGWTPVEGRPDYLGWIRGTVLKTLRYDEGSGWIWGTHETPFSSKEG